MFSFGAIIRSGITGFIVGILPGAGATIASAMTYSTERKIAGERGASAKAICAASRRQ